MEWLRDRKNRLTVSILAEWLLRFWWQEDSGCHSIRLHLHGGEPCIRNFAFRREAETAPERFPSGLRKCWNGDMI